MVRSYAILTADMKLLFAIVILILIALSLFADYKWKKWIAERMQDRDK